MNTNTHSEKNKQQNVVLLQNFIMANNEFPSMDWQSSNLAETFKLFKQWLELYFVANKIKIEPVNYILLRVGNEV